VGLAHHDPRDDGGRAGGRFAAERRDDGLAADLVLDPFCGSGTLLAEALEVALGLAAGRRRRPPFEASPAWKRRALPARRARRGHDGAAPPAAPPRQRRRRGRRRSSHGATSRRPACSSTRSLEVRRAQELDLDAIAQRQRASRPLLLSNPPYGRAAAASARRPTSSCATC
jgi:putative N6-adenine-specific DNA methylase